MKVIDIQSEIDLTSVGDAGLEVGLAASAASLAKLADACEVDSIGAISGALWIKPWRKTGFSLIGRFQADVVQTCVVSLEPVASTSEVEVELYFLPEDEIVESEFVPGEEVEIGFDDPDPPEPIIGDLLSLFDILREQLSLVLDPYPRAEGVTFETENTAEMPNESGKENPFAVLEALKGGKKP